MKKNLIILILNTLLVAFSSCNQSRQELANNLWFKKALDDYTKYIDSIGYNKDSEYIYIEAKRVSDSTKMLIYLDGGSYSFIAEKDYIIDLFSYGNYNVLLVGDFPNEIIKIKKNEDLNVLEDIVRKKYPTDYEKYVMDDHSVVPLIYDSMNLKLIFKNGKLCYCKKQYF